MKKLICVLLAVCLLCSCVGKPIEPTVTTEATTTLPPVTEPAVPTTVIEKEATILGKFMGSFLTVRMSPNPLPHDLPHIEVFSSYSEVESYYNSNIDTYFTGQKFTMTCYSFTDEYLENCDIVMLVIEEPSTYISHRSDVISVTDNIATFNLERHIPENAPTRQGAVYHLIYTVPKGSFNGIDCENAKVNIKEVIDDVNTDVFDTERFRYIYPEFWPNVLQVEAISQNALPSINVLNTYGEMLGFYESYKQDFNLDSEFLSQIGSHYNEQHFEDYVVIMAILPFDKNRPTPNVSNMFLYNLEVFLIIENLPAQVANQDLWWHIVGVSVSKNDLEGINLKEINIGS